MELRGGGRQKKKRKEPKDGEKCCEILPSTRQLHSQPHNNKYGPATFHSGQRRGSMGPYTPEEGLVAGGGEQIFSVEYPLVSYPINPN